MAHCKQALKRIRQSEKLRICRKSVRNEIKTLSKKITDLVTKKDEQARVLFQQAVSKIDKAAKTQVIHPNNASRKKSRLTARLKKLAA